MTSLAASQGNPLLASYAASKAFELVLAEGLWAELRERGVDVLACRAGATRTPGYAASRPRRSVPLMEPADVAEKALDALGRRTGRGHRRAEPGGRLRVRAAPPAPGLDRDHGARHAPALRMTRATRLRARRRRALPRAPRARGRLRGRARRRARRGLCAPGAAPRPRRRRGRRRRHPGGVRLQRPPRQLEPLRSVLERGAHPHRDLLGLPRRGGGGSALRRAWVLAIVCVWGARLTANQLARWRGLGDEDFRYRELRARSGRGYWPLSLVGIHLLPTAWVFLGLLPAYPALAGRGRPWRALDLAAVAVAGAAVLLEAVADRQLRWFLRSRRDPAAVLATGVWARLRHPNYLGQIGSGGGFPHRGGAAPAFAWAVPGRLLSGCRSSS